MIIVTKAILFDMDGVLIDSKRANRIFYQNLLEHFGYKRPAAKAVDALFGLTLSDAIRALAKGAPESKLNEIYTVALRDEISYPYNLVKPTDKEEGKILETLSKVYILGIVTNSDATDLKYAASFLKPDSFKVIITAEDFSRPKPDPEPLLLAAKKLGVEPNECVYIGDLETDMEAARAAGMRFILYSRKPAGYAVAKAGSFTDILKAVVALKGLNRISSDASRFLYEKVGISIAAPEVAVSTKARDAAWYSNGKIYLNPEYNPEGLADSEMIAHEFFHCAQTKTHLRLAMHGKAKVNFLESSAMFFAAAYMCRKKNAKSAKEFIIKYLGKKEHSPKGGNRRILLLFKKKKYDIVATLSDLLK